MTKERASANDTVMPAKPVSYWEHEYSNGLALLGDEAYREKIDYAQALRRRQADYLDSLPTEPKEAISAARMLLHPCGDEYPDGVEEALHLSYALAAMVKAGDTDDESRSRDAAIYLSDRLAQAMHRAALQLDRVSDILRNPGRIERDGIR